MERILSFFVAAVIAAVAGVLILASGKQKTFRIERSRDIKAPPGRILPLIANFHNWQLWSPFEKMDPNMKRTFSGAMEGKGAVYAWEGKGRTGKGSMEITEETPDTLIIRLNFLKPMKAQNTVEFTLAPKGDETRVRWAMLGRNSHIAKIFQVFMNMDKSIGAMFDDGLANLANATVNFKG